MTVQETSSRTSWRAADPGIVTFLFHEAWLLDSRHYDEWIDLLDDDFEYLVPTPLVREDPALPSYDERGWTASENKASFGLKLLRITSDHAWADRPAAFQRHHVTNVVQQDGEGGEVVVRSNVIVTRARQPAPFGVFSAERVDRLRPDSDRGYRLVARTVHLDTDLATAAQLSIVY